MDENSSPVSTPSSTNSSPAHHTTYELVSPLQAKTNKTRYEVLSDSKKHTTLSSPVRSPLSDKNTSTNISPHHPHQFNKQRASSPAAITTTTTTTTTATAAAAATTTTTKQSPVKPKRIDLQEPVTTCHASIDSLQTRKVQALQQELNTLKTKVKNERQRTAKMMTWEKTMMELIQHYKEIQLDLDDSVDILVEFDQVETDLMNEKQNLQEKQRRVDELMNLVPERIYQIEQIKQQLV